MCCAHQGFYSVCVHVIFVNFTKVTLNSFFNMLYLCWCSPLGETFLYVVLHTRIFNDLQRRVGKK
jgi:hypothetical protein